MCVLHFLVFLHETGTLVSSYVVKDIIKFAAGERWNTEVYENLNPTTVNLKMYANHVIRQEAMQLKETVSIPGFY